MSFTDGKPWTVTARDTQGGWGGRENGDGFRCYLCGHRFAPGDTARWEYAGGRGHINLLVCSSCDDTPQRLTEKFLALVHEYNADRFWVFKD